MGNAVTAAYDVLGRPTTVQSPAQDKAEYIYDANSNPVLVKQYAWNQATAAYEQLDIERSYDARDRLIQATRKDPGGTIVSTSMVEYDGRDLVTKTTDPMGNTVAFTWDALRRILTEKRDLRVGGSGAGQVTTTVDKVYAYDLGSRLLSLANGLGHATSWQYDARDRVTSETDPAGKSTTYSYDANGNVTGRIDRLGTSVTRTYGNMDQLTAVSVNRAAGVLGTTSETIQYDLLGQLMSWTDNDSTLEWSYDSLGRTVSEKSGANPIGTTGKTFSFGYDSTGNTTSIGYPDGTTLNYARDAIGRMTSASLQGGATLGTYQYAGSRVLSIALQNAVTKTLTYDAAWRATFVEYRKAATSIKKFEYARNLADKRLLEKRHHSGGTGDNYELDSQYRTILVKAGVADPVAELANPGSHAVTSTTTLTLDTANNRAQRAVAAGGSTTTTN